MSDAPSRVPVRILAKYGVYNAGEVAGFPPEECAQMIADGIAEPFDAAAARVLSVEDFVPEGEDTPSEAPRAKKGK